MRMQWRVVVFSVIFLVGGLAVPLLIGNALGSDLAVWVTFLIWFATFATLQFVLFRCPHCRKVAIVTPAKGALQWRWGTPFVGRRCRYCGGEY